MTAEEALARAKTLLVRLEELRTTLEQTDDTDAALDLLGELAELAREIATEIERAKAEVDAQS